METRKYVNVKASKPADEWTNRETVETYILPAKTAQTTKTQLEAVGYTVTISEIKS